MCQCQIGGKNQIRNELQWDQQERERERRYSFMLAPTRQRRAERENKRGEGKRERKRERERERMERKLVVQTIREKERDWETVSSKCVRERERERERSVEGRKLSSVGSTIWVPGSQTIRTTHTHSFTSLHFVINLNFASIYFYAVKRREIANYLLWELFLLRIEVSGMNSSKCDSFRRFLRDKCGFDAERYMYIRPELRKVSSRVV